MNEHKVNLHTQMTSSEIFNMSENIKQLFISHGQSSNCKSNEVDSFKELAELLRSLKTLDKLFESEEIRTKYTVKLDHGVPWIKSNVCSDSKLKHTEVGSLIITIQKAIESVLITPEGSINCETKETLETFGYILSPGEQDSFGWLSGIITSKNFKLVFG